MATPVAPAKLVYQLDDIPGLGRLRRGKTFRYVRADGSPLRDVSEIDRIRRLAIPPAYTDVWICPLPHGHLQATGRDARGRKQFRYHADWRRARDESKFDRMQEFGAALPRIRARVQRDLSAAAGPGVARASVIASVVRLLDTTFVRVGNDEYARSNQSFGLTTLRNRHAAVKGDELRLSFRGKSGVLHSVAVHDKRVARIVKRCQALPGQRLFEFTGDDGAAHGIDSSDVNDYLREASGGAFTAKDFRTWHGSVQALQLFQRHAAQAGAAPTRASANQLLADVAALLGNTVAVCRKSYVHPQVLALLTPQPAAAGAAGSARRAAAVPRRAGLTAAERAFLAFLG